MTRAEAAGAQGPVQEPPWPPATSQGSMSCATASDPSHMDANFILLCPAQQRSLAARTHSGRSVRNQVMAANSAPPFQASGTHLTLGPHVQLYPLCGPRHHSCLEFKFRGTGCQSSFFLDSVVTACAPWTSSGCWV